jgi:hypothetical protein
MIWFDRHLQDVIEEQAAAPERIASKQRARQIFFTCNLRGGTFSVRATGKTSAGAA